MDKNKATESHCISGQVQYPKLQSHWPQKMAFALPYIELRQAYMLVKPNTLALNVAHPSNETYIEMPRGI